MAMQHGIICWIMCMCCLQGWTLLLIGPFLDRYVSSSWVFDFSYTFPALVFLVLSCSMAVFVNISQFMCLGRFSAVSFQVNYMKCCCANHAAELTQTGCTCNACDIHAAAWSSVFLCFAACHEVCAFRTSLQICNLICASCVI